MGKVPPYLNATGQIIEEIKEVDESLMADSQLGNRGVNNVTPPKA
jgi:hypothetical protein